MIRIKKFNESDNSIHSEIWKYKFRDKSASGKYWQKLFGDEFESHKFLDRSDAVSICKIAQRDAYTEIINILEANRVNIEVINEVKASLERIEDEDNSGLGM
jgi:hypothetical protein